MVIDDSARGLLLSLARESVTAGLGSAAPPPPPDAAGLPPSLLERRATFVTLKRMGLLRGCCGLLEPIRPLAHDVWHNAWASAFQDPRYPPLAADELTDLDIGISILSELERVWATSEAGLLESLEPGRHGLVLAFGARRATFLPQVWKSLPDPSRFLGELKEKAGWPRDFWSPRMEAWRYTTLSLGQAD
jgi:AmmeMemoRadiSam system protein A